MIDYDRLVTGGPADRYYVSFDNVKVGQLIGQGEVDCITAWNVSKPNILIMDGDPTDNNAKLFAQGYNGVLQPKFDDGSYVKVGEPAGTWDPPTAQTTFEQQYTAHPNINAVVTPNDDNANAVIASLQKDKIPPKTFPTTGQDASPVGPAEHPQGLPVRHGLQADLPRGAGRRRARAVPAGGRDAAGVAGERDDDGHRRSTSDIKSVYTTPIWVTTDNMADTVVKDGAIKAADLCAGALASACTAAGSASLTHAPPGRSLDGSGPAAG